MYLKTLHLKQFRNYRDQRVEFFTPKTILVGDNAQGKSNVLEAVELLATLRSHRNGRDRDLVQTGETVGLIEASVQRYSGMTDLAITLRSGGRRTLSCHHEPVRRQVDFLGHLSAVQFSSLDLDLVRGGPDGRRMWLDTLLIQLEPVYAYILQQYNHVLKQRNALLKGHKLQRSSPPGPVSSGGALAQVTPDDITQLALWDDQLATIAVRVMRRRQRALARLAPIAQRWHHTISNCTEHLALTYAPNVTWAPQDEVPSGQALDDPDHIHQAFLAAVQQRTIAEQHQGTSLVGPHRDDIDLLINQTPARQYGSQGQQRTLVLALKLAELTLIEEVIGEPPLLLLDDVLAELDPSRQNQLLTAIQDRFQTLITTTHLGSFAAEWQHSSQILSVCAGHIECADSD